MKQFILAITGLFYLSTLFAQDNIFVFQSDSSVTAVKTSAIDSVSFSENGAQLNLIKAGQTKSNLTVSTIDSITFSGNLPVIRAMETPIQIDQAKAKMAIIVSTKGGSAILSKGLCWSLYPHPTIDSLKIVSGATLDSSTVYMTKLVAGSTYYVRPFITNSSGTTYGQEFSVNVPGYTLPDVETVSITYNGNLEAICTGKVNSSGGYPVLIARGFCWSTSATPTIDDNRIPFGLSNGSYTTTVKFPNANVKYYVRAFATNTLGTSYGETMAITPLLGNVTYHLDFTPANDTEKNYYRLIKIAMDSACYYYNRYTTFSINIYVYYNAGIPTAQASYHGSIGFGSGTSYMDVCTAMHEMAHYMGSGTTQVWQDLTVNGVYTGAAATQMLRTVTNDPTAILHGDDMHFWPYGLNYKSEVSSAQDYIRHAKIVNAMKTDCGW